MVDHETLVNTTEETAGRRRIAKTGYGPKISSNNCPLFLDWKGTKDGRKDQALFGAPLTTLKPFTPFARCARNFRRRATACKVKAKKSVPAQSITDNK